MSHREDVQIYQKAKKQLNFRPKVKLENGLKNFIEWAKHNYSF